MTHLYLKICDFNLITMTSNPTILKTIPEDRQKTLDDLLHEINILEDLRHLEYKKRPFIQEIVELTIQGYDVIEYMRAYRTILRSKNWDYGKTLL